MRIAWFKVLNRAYVMIAELAKQQVKVLLHLASSKLMISAHLTCRTLIVAVHLCYTAY